MAQKIPQEEAYMPDGIDYMLAKMKGEYIPNKTIRPSQAEELLKKYTSTQPNPSLKVDALAKLMSLKHGLSVTDILNCLEGLAISDQEDILKAAI